MKIEENLSNLNLQMEEFIESSIKKKVLDAASGAID